MARALQKLSAKAAEKKIEPGYYSDGGGLYLQVSSTRTKSWLFRFMLNGKAREMGLGSMLGVSLADARAKAADCRKLLADRIDPIAARDAGRAQLAVSAAKSVTFTTCAERFIEAHKAGWKNDKHVSQWENTIATYAEPFFGSAGVAEVDTGLVLKALEPIWSAKPETASRVRGRIERVLDWAKARGYRHGDNPARWRGHLDKLLPKLEKRKRIKHHAALPFDHVAEFMAAVRAQEGVAARALELTILTATRTGEVVGARWCEIDLKAAVWCIPPERMKAHREHRVPLSAQALKVLRALEPLRRDDDFVFPGMRDGAPLSNMAMLELLKRMERDDITVHGFRSSFRDWTAERTNYPREGCEMALAHTVGNEVEAAYRRGDLFEKRRALMREWAKHCETTTRGNVVPLRRKATA
jgi:integrase